MDHRWLEASCPGSCVLLQPTFAHMTPVEPIPDRISVRPGKDRAVRVDQRALCLTNRVLRGRMARGDSEIGGACDVDRSHDPKTAKRFDKCQERSNIGF